MKYSHMSVVERETVERMLWGKASIRSIAKALGRSHTSISREVRRCDLRAYMYKSRLGHERALLKRKSRGRKDRLKSEAVRSYVVLHLKERWSPEQISGRMKRDGVGSISHEAIYQFVYAQVHRDGYGYLRPGAEDLRVYLRRKRRRRQPKGMRKCRRVLAFRGTSIEERPKAVDEKKRVGDWESDSVESCDHKPGVNSLLERKTGLYLVTKVRDHGSASTVAVISKRLGCMPRHTITFDNGPENQRWRELEDALHVDTFFAHSYSSWERGANENANGLLREYFPKKTDFTLVPDEEIAKVEYALNMRPRKRLNWLTLLEVFSGAVRG
jgi:IS30 family transposase